MHGRALSAQERQVLAEIEAGLRATDGRLHRRLSTMRPRMSPWFPVARVAGQVPMTALMVLVALSFIVLRASMQAPSAVDLTAVGLVWAAVLVLLSARVVAGRRRRRGR
ncbi:MULTISPECIES: DUF3040 domain-containing protein [unclassified Kitasatospora]|uniref:DUF3040 domain-containing protein n=1 Tax=unclassified Kitasatospora TaxID=2633591 RepID=UPI00365A4840